MFEGRSGQKEPLLQHLPCSGCGASPRSPKAHCGRSLQALELTVGMKALPQRMPEQLFINHTWKACALTEQTCGARPHICFMLADKCWGPSQASPKAYSLQPD